MAWIPAIIGLVSAAASAYASYQGSKNKDKTQKLSTLTPEQNQFVNMLMSNLSGGSLGQGFGESTDYLRKLVNQDPEAMKQFTQPHVNEFNQVTVPNLAERFAGAGGGLGGGLSSSGFAQGLSSAGSNLQTNLAALKAGLGQQAAGQLMGSYGGLANTALGIKPFGYAYQQGGPGFGGQFAQSYAQQGMPGMEQLLQALSSYFSKTNTTPVGGSS